MWIVLVELDVSSIDGTLRGREEVLCRIEVRGELLMPYCPRCFDCDGDEPLLEPYICDNCWKEPEQ